MRKAQAGFTLIELVVVIVILGILAATALPRFVNMSDEATAAARNGVMGGINSAISIAHAKWLANGHVNPTLDGAAAAVVMNASGYPNIGGADYDSKAECEALMLNLMGSTSGLEIDYGGGNCTVDGTPTTYGTVISVSPTGAS